MSMWVYYTLGDCNQTGSFYVIYGVTTVTGAPSSNRRVQRGAVEGGRESERERERERNKTMRER